MKSKEEAAEKIYKEPIKYTIGGAFLAGIDFAEQWISVEDELPERFDDTWVSKLVLVRTNKYSCIVGFYDFDTKEWISIETKKTLLNAVEWRPINRK